jgi:hypothetical protein
MQFGGYAALVRMKAEVIDPAGVEQPRWPSHSEKAIAFARAELGETGFVMPCRTHNDGGLAAPQHDAIRSLLQRDDQAPFG